MAARMQIEAKAAIRVRRTRQGTWDLIRDLGADGRRFGRADVVAASRVHKDTIRDYLRALLAAGIIAVEESDQTLFYLARDVGPEAPRVRKDGSPAAPQLGQDHMWRVMQMAPGGFTASDLAITATTEDVAVKLATAKTYIQRLRVAGYLDVLSAGGPGVQAVYALKRSMRTGPRAPMVLTAKVVWDPNLGKPMGTVDADEEAGHVAN